MQTTFGLEEILWIKKGQGIAARGRIPEDSEFFKDHFPGFPVLPGVLALEMLKQTAEHYLRQSGKSEGYQFSIKKITGVKFSRYLKPGDEWESNLTFESEENNLVKWVGKLLYQGQVAVSAKMILETLKIQPVSI